MQFNSKKMLHFAKIEHFFFIFWQPFNEKAKSIESKRFQ